jgi:hypothetical protein
MLSHFHGIQHADDHKRIYQGLDVEIDIAEGRVILGQFFILKFDFSTINRSTNIEDANTFLKTNIANSLRLFYKTYSPYLPISFLTTLIVKIPPVLSRFVMLFLQLEKGEEVLVFRVLVIDCPLPRSP